MPKLKTNRAATKRFKRTAKGRYKHKCANKNHILTKKSPQRKRRLRTFSLIRKHDEKSVKKMLAK